MSVEVITTISPTTNEAIVTRNGISQPELTLLAETASKAFKTWRTTKLSDRQIIVRKALDVLASRTDELARELTEQMGRPIAYTGKEVATAIKRAEFLLKASDEALKDTPGETEKGYERFIRKVPVGPVLVIFAWNVSLLFGFFFSLLFASFRILGRYARDSLLHLTHPFNSVQKYHAESMFTILPLVLSSFLLPHARKSS